MTCRLKLVLYIGAALQTLDYIGPFDRIPAGWSYKMRVVRRVG